MFRHKAVCFISLIFLVYLAFPSLSSGFSLFGQADSRGVLRERLTEKMSTASENDELSVIINYNKPIDDKRWKFLKEHGVLRYEYSLFNGLAVRLPKKIIEQLAREDRNIVWIEFDFPVRAYLDKAVPHINADEAKTNYGVTGKGVKVAVLDTGVNKNHPSLQANVITQIDFTGEGKGDFNGHGTHVACIIGCTTQPYVGVAPQVSLVDVKVLDAQGEGDSSTIIAGIDWAVSQDIPVISLSLGADTDCDGTDPLSVAVDAAYDQGVFPVVAAGNSGPMQQTVGTPGCANKAFTVGAINDYNQVALFSSRGPTADGRVKPDIFAPGVAIISASLGDDYATLSGTSQATPFVSATAALLLDADSDLSPQELRDTLVKTAFPLPRAFVNTQDQGIVDALSANAHVAGDEITSPSEPTQSVSSEDSNQAFDQARQELTLCLREAENNIEQKQSCLSEFLARQREIQFGRFSEDVQEVLQQLETLAQDLALEVQQNNNNRDDATISRALSVLGKIAAYLSTSTSAQSIQATLQSLDVIHLRHH